MSPAVLTRTKYTHNAPFEFLQLKLIARKKGVMAIASLACVQQLPAVYRLPATVGEAGCDRRKTSW